MKYAHAALVFMFLGVATALAQDQKQPLPAITFDVYWEAATPQKYTVTVDSEGKAKYVSSNPTRPEEGAQAGDPGYVVEFTMSAANRDRLFELAKETNYFHGDFEYRQHAIANTGKKILSYSDPVRSFQTTYNWSENRAIQEATRIFQGISNTLEHAQKLKFKRRFDKLGLETELKGMEDLAQNKNLAELQVIAPTLQSIADDPAVLNIARQRAKRLLAQAGTTTD